RPVGDDAQAASTTARQAPKRMLPALLPAFSLFISLLPQRRHYSRLTLSDIATCSGFPVRAAAFSELPASSGSRLQEPILRATQSRARQSPVGRAPGRCHRFHRGSRLSKRRRQPAESTFSNTS